MTLGPFIGFTDVQEEGFFGVQLEGGFDIGCTEKRAGGCGAGAGSCSSGCKGGDGDGWEDEEDGENLHGALFISFNNIIYVQ